MRLFAIILLFTACRRNAPVTQPPVGTDSASVDSVIVYMKLPVNYKVSKIDFTKVPISETPLPLPINIYQKQIDALKLRIDSMAPTLQKAVAPPTTTALQTQVNTLQTQLTAVKATIKKDTLVVGGQPGYIKMRQLRSGSFVIEIDSAFSKRYPVKAP